MAIIWLFLRIPIEFYLFFTISLQGVESYEFTACREVIMNSL